MTTDDIRQKPKKRGRQTAANRKALQAVFLRQFEASGEIGPSARTAGINRDTHYHWLQTDPAYRAAYADAEQMRVEILEKELRRRGLVGWDEPIFWRGQKIGDRRVYSDACLIFALKGEKPNKYRERHEHMGTDGAPLTFTLTLGDRSV